MLTIYEPPRQYAVQRETANGGRVRVGLYPTLEEAKEAVARSVIRTGREVAAHSIWCASWEAINDAEWASDVQRIVAASDPIDNEEDQ